MKSTSLSLLLLLLVGCATTPSTPFSNPSITVPGMSADAARAYVSQRCVTGGARLEINTPTQVICAKAFDDSFGSVMYRALLTPSYSTRPDAKVRYNFFESAGQVMVAADMYIEYQNAYGQKNVTPLEHVGLRDQAQAMLQRMKDEHIADAAIASTQDGARTESATRLGGPSLDDLGRRHASSIGCPVDFARVSSDGTRAIYETSCPNTRRRVLLECKAAGCTTLN